MNEIEKHVTSLELSRRLKGLGCPQRSYFDWVKENGELTIWNPTQVSDYVTGNQEFLCSAYLSSELGEWMPEFVKTYKRSGEYWCDYLYLENPRLDEDYARTEVQSIEANAKAKMLIWLVENNYLDPKSL